MDAKLRAAWAVVRAASRRGDEWLLWAVELYDPAAVYRTLLTHGYTYDRRLQKWAA